MANLVTLPAVAAMAIAGTGLGLYLGKSAISEIDPVYFNSPLSASRFHADLVPSTGSFEAAPMPQDASLAQGLGSGCVGCRTYPEEYFPIHDPAVDPYVQPYAQASIEPAADIIEDVDREIQAVARRAEVERYVHFRVAAEERPANLAQAEPEETPQPDCAEGQCEDEAVPAT